MRLLKSFLTPVIILSVLISLEACHAKKKVVQQPEPPADTTRSMPPPPPAPAPAPAAQEAAPAPAPNYNFSNVQFEFDSSILRTASYPVLDNAAAEMRKDPSVTFVINGYASSEGPAAHNMSLSRDRANSVKVYLVNSGIPSSKLIVKGNGIANSVGDNGTESGRVLNRRVEIKKQ